jgi:hypothetical protein
MQDKDEKDAPIREFKKDAPWQYFISQILKSISIISLRLQQLDCFLIYYPN